MNVLNAIGNISADAEIRFLANGDIFPIADKLLMIFS